MGPNKTNPRVDLTGYEPTGNVMIGWTSTVWFKIEIHVR